MLALVSYALYGVQWLSGVVAWGSTADRLQAPCYFGKTANCGVLIFAGAVAWLALCALIAARVLPHVSGKFQPPHPAVERNAYYGLTGVWGVVALVASATAPTAPARRTTGDVAIAAAWINFLAHVASCVLARLGYAADDSEIETLA